MASVQHLNQKPLLVAAAFAAAVAAIAGIRYFTVRPSLHGSIISPPAPAADIALTDFNGEPFSLMDQRGRVLVLYFGYTHCPDECPLALAHLKLATDILGERAKEVGVVMVTTDPERDTAEVLRTFLGRFDAAFIGLRGSSEELTKVWKAYGVTVENSGEVHSNYIYVIDSRGNLVETLVPDAEAGDIAADLRLLVEAK